ncbi:hypothetical protein BU24DRAFT_222428 [Aaosphaeria arxii CBS 175.79]|uniref:Uncharacterized protein n=1 Tax=Aaosphaeria arxii CBS 175.79 TaxID=1450172 RepID=A0A6A5XNU4_9PLEO|nr:uncharacterized protein BU24DRAFT_222428 [Aaosphaeria arxii CBS 175.79]KAF2014812.1 hypothetical protein BU24DRAFT_222428 [Aaosphaeria arxii CBS 175.79]
MDGCIGWLFAVVHVILAILFTFVASSAMASRRFGRGSSSRVRFLILANCFLMSTRPLLAYGVWPSQKGRMAFSITLNEPSSLRLMGSLHSLTFSNFYQKTSNETENLITQEWMRDGWIM